MEHHADTTKMVRFIFGLLLIVAACSGSPVGPQIIGGSDAAITDFPYIVSVEYYGLLSCGGAIISADWVLTHGGCAAEAVNVTHFTIRSGSALIGNGTLHNIVQWIHHPLNNVTKKEYDFALVQVDPPFEFGENVAPVTLATQDQDTPDGAAALIAGWGMKNVAGGEFTSSHLQMGETAVLGEAACSETLGSDYQYSKLCVQDPNGVVTQCYYDEGGPLVVNGTAYGIILHPVDCVDPLAVQVYSRIASVRDWIDSTIAG